LPFIIVERVDFQLDRLGDIRCDRKEIGAICTVFKNVNEAVADLNEIGQTDNRL
jgi:hypothetical protein